MFKAIHKKTWWKNNTLLQTVPGEEDGGLCVGGLGLQSVVYILQVLISRQLW